MFAPGTRAQHTRRMPQPTITDPAVRKQWDEWLAARRKRFAAAGAVHPELEPVSDIVALAMISHKEPKG